MPPALCQILTLDDNFLTLFRWLGQVHLNSCHHIASLFTTHSATHPNLGGGPCVWATPNMHSLSYDNYMLVQTHEIGLKILKNLHLCSGVKKQHIG